MMYVCICVCMCVRMCMYVCACVLACVRARLCVGGAVLGRRVIVLVLNHFIFATCYGEVQITQVIVSTCLLSLQLPC